MELDPQELHAFQAKILTWYTEHKRDLPWRKTHDPYKILVSEVMLQQTQVSRVVPKYEEWLAAFPSVESLAQATVSEVLECWMGLGYNRRALYLQKTADEIVKRGRWPQTEKELLTLPGIGKYTAHALLCFAFLQEIAVVDTNVRKVILVEIYKNPTKKVSERDIETVAKQLVPSGKAYIWNQALMDYASDVLRSVKIPIPKQSAYQGSDRYYRARILQLLLKKQKIKQTALGPLLREDFSEDHTIWLEKILGKMEKDGLIKLRNNEIVIA